METNSHYGVTEVSRTARHTCQYARATLDLAKEKRLVVVDLFRAFMGTAFIKEGQLRGSLSGGKDVALAGLFTDGEPLALELLLECSHS